jgi:hypothetical protein
MAETLSVTDMLPNKFEPKRNYRWILAVEGIDKGAFITNANFQSLDYTGDEIMKIDVTIAYDNCVLQF